MERPTRRSATSASVNGTSDRSGHGTSAHGSHAQHSNGSKDAGNGGSGLSTSRRRRREAEVKASSGATSASDTDSSSVAVEMSAGASTGKNAQGKKKGGRGRAQDEEEDGDARDGEADQNQTPVPVDPATEEDEGEADAEEEEEDEPPAPTGYATRARRERSQSVVSTTSDASSVVSEHHEEPLRPELHAEKVAELEKKRQMVEEGTLAEYCRRVAEFKEERNRLLQTAEWHKNLQLKNTADLYGFEVQRAHNIWRDSKEEIKLAMLKQTDALLDKLKQELDHLDKTGSLPRHIVVQKKTLLPTTATFDTAKKEHKPVVEAMPEPSQETVHNSGPEMKTPPPTKRRKVSPPMPDNVMRLPLDDVTADLANIMQMRDAASAKIHAALPATRLELRVDRRRLLCGKYVFEEGDEVVVTAAVLKEDYIGVISSVSEEELYVKLSSGQKVRVTVDHIALRRCEIRPFLRGSAGIDSLQSSGWVECEPF